MDEAEYQETKEDTIEQLKEFNESLNRLVKGDISLISAIGAIQLVSYLKLLFICFYNLFNINKRRQSIVF